MVALSAGTTHRPAILDADGRVQTESRAGARLSDRPGDRADRIFCEATSYDTIGNAYFSRVQIVEPLGWTRLLIITSNFHVPRAEAVFRCAVRIGRGALRVGICGLTRRGVGGGGVIGPADSGKAESGEGARELREKLTSMRSLAGWLFRGAAARTRRFSRRCRRMRPGCWRVIERSFQLSAFSSQLVGRASAEAACTRLTD